MNIFVVKTYSEAYEGESTEPYFFSSRENAQEYLKANEGWYEGDGDKIWIEEYRLDDWNERVKDLETNEDWF